MYAINKIVLVHIVNQALVDALTILQHRGQDAAGIVTSHNNRLNLRKDTGSVSDVIKFPLFYSKVVYYWLMQLGIYARERD